MITKGGTARKRVMLGGDDGKDWLLFDGKKIHRLRRGYGLSGWGEGKRGGNGKTNSPKGGRWDQELLEERGLSKYRKE